MGGRFVIEAALLCTVAGPQSRLRQRPSLAPPQQRLHLISVHSVRGAPALVTATAAKVALVTTWQTDECTAGDGTQAAAASNLALGRGLPHYKASDPPSGPASQPASKGNRSMGSPPPRGCRRRRGATRPAARAAQSWRSWRPRTCWLPSCRSLQREWGNSRRAGK